MLDFPNLGERRGHLLRCAMKQTHSELVAFLITTKLAPSKFNVNVYYNSYINSLFYIMLNQLTNNKQKLNNR